MNAKVFLGIFLASAMVMTTSAADIENIEVVNNETVNVMTSTDVVVPEGEVDTDVKILKDLVVSFAYKSPEDAKKVTLNLTYELSPNKMYSIMGVAGAEASMDFETGDKVVSEIMNKEETQSGVLAIEKINIIDEKTIDIHYNTKLDAEEFLFKVLREIPVTEKTGNGLNTVQVKVADSLEALTPYILIMSYMHDIDTQKVEFAESIYEFETEDNLEVVNDKIVDEEVVEEEAPSEPEGNIEEVALESARTPDTGAATWVLLLFTFLVSGFFVVKSRLK